MLPDKSEAIEGVF